MKSQVVMGVSFLTIVGPALAVARMAPFHEVEDRVDMKSGASPTTTGPVTPIQYFFRLVGRIVVLIERGVISVFIAVMLSLMFILVGQPGVDWLLVSPVFATISEVGVIVPIRAFLRSKTQQ